MRSTPINNFVRKTIEVVPPKQTVNVIQRSNSLSQEEVMDAIRLHLEMTRPGYFDGEIPHLTQIAPNIDWRDQEYLGFGVTVVAHDGSEGPSREEKAEKVLALIESYVADQAISCSEDVYQAKAVIESASLFMDSLCGVVGYASADDK